MTVRTSASAVTQRRERAILRAREDIFNNAAAGAFVREDNPTMDVAAKRAGHTASSLCTKQKDGRLRDKDKGYRSQNEAPAPRMRVVAGRALR